jgi:hypothetical protein
MLIRFNVIWTFIAYVVAYIVAIPYEGYCRAEFSKLSQLAAERRFRYVSPERLALSWELRRH